MPRAWGSRGRVNVVGHLVRGREGERLFFALLEGPVRWEVVRGYLDRVAEGLAKPLKVFMDNAPFHRSREVEGRKEAWRERGLMVAQNLHLCTLGIVMLGGPLERGRRFPV
ncbi:hypothetical protein TthAK1_07250 [Thermus thermophilus]|nr:hypothetical protein TthAK1_07250 [Thermus thermophilus]